ncbi:retrovirus-related pol polyprotein from transposon TNT 1-94 [Tanacetum coccineum]
MNCTKINLDNKSVNDTLTAELERYKEQVKVLKEGQNVDLKSKDNVSDSCEQSVEIDHLKQTLSEHLKEKESLMQTVTLLKNDFKKEESRNIDREIALEKKIKQLDNIVYKRDQSAQTVHMLTKPQFFYDHTTKQALGFQNPFYLKKAQQLEPKLYDGNVIKNTHAIVITDSEETLMLAEESRSKMLLKQQDPMVLEKKVNTTPVDYANSMNSSDPSPSCRPTKVEVPKELPKVSMSQEKDTVIKKLKERIKSLNGNLNKDKVKKDIEEIETLNIELDHRVSKLIAENEHLKQTYNLQEKDLVITALKNVLRKLKGKDLADTIVTKRPRLLNNRTAHSDYLRHTQEQAAILREILKQGKSQNPLNNSLDSACKYTKQIQELLIIIRQTYPSINNLSDKLVVVTPKNKNKRVRFTEPVTSSGNTNIKTASSSNLVSNKPMLSFTEVKPSTSASGSQTLGNTKKDKIQQTPRNANVQHSRLNANFKLLCVKKVQREKFGNQQEKCSQILDTLRDLLVVQIVLWYLDSGCSKHMTGDCSYLTNFVNKFLGTVKFGNDHVAKILGYGDYQIGNVTISRVYYVEGLGHNLFSVGQFCDSNLEVAFRQHTCFIRNLEGVDLLTGSRGNNLYTLSLGDMMASSPICLLSKASKTKSKDEAPDFIIKFLKMIQVRLKVPVRRIRTDNGTEFVNQTLREYYEKVGISHETSVARSPQQNKCQNDSEVSSYSDVIPTIMHTAAPNSEHVTKWTKDHPLDNIIGELKIPVSTRLQLHEQALFCYYDAFLTSVEPKTYTTD